MDNKKLIVIALIALLAVGWYTAVSGNVKTETTYASYVRLGDEQFEKELYQKAYNSYMEASKEKMTKKLQQKIVESYELYYAETESYDTYRSLLSVYANANTNYPSETKYWASELDLMIQYLDFEKAMKVYDNAVKSGAKEKELADQYQQILYASKKSGTSYTAFKNAYNGYFVMARGLKWNYLSDDLETDGADDYALMSGIATSEETPMLFLVESFDNQFYFIDQDNVKNGIVKDLTITDAKVYKEGKIAVCADGKYKYIDIDGNVLSADYEDASNFTDGVAAVKADGKWGLVDKDFKSVSAADFDDIKMTDVGEYVFGDTIVAAKGGQYQFYDTDLKAPKNDFKAEDLDIITADQVVAFKSGDKWGFVNADSGKVVIEPQYENARSFSNGLAAVCQEGKWGFINADNTPVTGFEYFDAQYINSKGTSVVKTSDEAYAILQFYFPERIKG